MISKDAVISKGPGRRSGSGACCRRGFTLIELVVASAILAGIVGAAWACMVAGLDRREDVAERMDLVQSARATMRLIAADLRLACSLSSEAAFVGMDRQIEEADADNLDLATHRWKPRRPGEADYCEVSWFVERDPATGELALFRRRDPTPDERPFEGGVSERIVGGVRAFSLEYYDGYVWYDSWGPEVDAGHGARPDRIDPADPWGGFGNEEGLPEAVRITLELDPEPVAFARRDVVRGGPRTGDPGRGEIESPDRSIVLRTVVRLELAGRVNDALLGGSFADTSSGAGTSDAASDTPDAANAPVEGGDGR